MKSLLIALSIFATFSSAQAQTNVDTTPVFRPHCEKHNYRFLNMISNMQKLSETDTQVTFAFDSSVVSCTDQVLAIVLVNPSLVYVGISRSGLSGIFGHSFVHEQHQATTDATHVVLNFDKTRALDQEHVERKFDMIYSPWGANSYYFPWIVTISKDASGSASLNVQVR
jgi:hypothetical protein